MLLSIGATALPNPDNKPLSSAESGCREFVIIAVLEADVHRHALVRERRGDAVVAELAGDIGMQRAQGRGSLRGAQLVQVVELLPG